MVKGVSRLNPAVDEAEGIVGDFAVFVSLNKYDVYENDLY